VKRWLFVASVLAIVVLRARQVAVQAQNCTDAHCIYVPAINVSNGPTPTIDIFGPIPPELTGPCTVHEPAPIEGGQAWLDTYNLAPGDTATLCVRLIEHGQVVPNALAAGTIHYPDRDASIDGRRGDSKGVTTLLFTVGSVKPGQLIVIDAVAIGNQHDWPAQVTFLSQAVPTNTPIATLTKTPGPTATTTPTSTATNTPTTTPTSTATDTPTP
jgi:hypothetical protein